MELPRVGSSCSSSSKIGSQGGTQFGVIGVQHLREAWGWACSHLIALFAQICFTHHTHTRTHLKNTTRFFFFGIFLSWKKHVRSALNGSSCSTRSYQACYLWPNRAVQFVVVWEVGRLTTPTTTTSAHPLHSPPPTPSTPTPLLLSRRLTSCHLRHFEPNRNLT